MGDDHGPHHGSRNPGLTVFPMTASVVDIGYFPRECRFPPPPTCPV